MKTILTNQRGQGVTEMVLLFSVLMLITLLINQRLSDMEFGPKLVKGPWENLQGMVECGVWRPCRGVAGLHPNGTTRNISLKPEGQ
ncbi:MAG: hypothetical protein LW875_03460 [Proteobacteria bacterium]|nr:hypothetical protein [Pseudomonadota bacterium]